ncbi:hypothetical protein MO867_16530 [Microbulbifer sp. OS29]|uniref:Uncharacterized protein n=1 Tax=Microbulbifer okhotskensis TaxID=2926617 RepID=A0A9X2J8U8_9GAMM|nr:hypothetical protein [Microbulbifer okhotskensis]MCO1335941.1 hypothetical protein [Microbulbifer okhotskensis]
MLQNKTAINLIASLVAFFSISAHSKSVMNAEFRTLKACLSAIEKNGGGPLKIITDKPKEVSGFLANGEGFACERKVTGSKGTYYHGWFMVK